MRVKPTEFSALDTLVRQVTRCGMTDGTVMVCEFISGFEIFGGYETWRQGWRVHGLGVFAERERLEDAIDVWAARVALKRQGGPIAPDGDLSKHGRDGGPYRAAEVLPDWITRSGTEPVHD